MSPINLNTGAEQLMRELFEIQLVFQRFGVAKKHRDTIEAIALKAYKDEVSRVRGKNSSELIFKEES